MDVQAAAKINLFLRVLDRRPDGYHTIETVYQSVGLSDRLHFRQTNEGIRLDCCGGDLPEGKDNLVVRAAELMKRLFPGRVGGLDILLEKHIPAGSGLGGGSADAAATLRVCNDLFRLGLTGEQLRALAAQIGMDVAFLIEGGRAIGRQRGEQIEPLEMDEEGWAVIAVPPVSISTRWAYEELDRQGPSQLPAVESFVERLAGVPVARWAGLCANDFERVVFPAYPPVKELRDRLLQAGCAGAFLTGSGAAVVGLTDDPKRAVRVAQEMQGSCRMTKAVPFLKGSVKA